ncbi:MAG: hypothetical protein JXR41_12530 [Bacteroidales bacterium]|nr:hypothetical protein [Bacteroidales bacterium]MBN2763912.1 hypothetical protein [Bacteroidales bacterium]
MDTFHIELIGYLAAFFGTILMLPQTIKTFRTKNVRDISFLMLVIYIVNCTLWGIYGFYLHSGPMLLCNSIALIIGILMLIMKIGYSRHQETSELIETGKDL